MSKGWYGPSLVLLHSASIQIWRKIENSISEPFLPSEVLGKWLNQLGILKNIMLGTNIIKIGPSGPDKAFGASKQPYSIAARANFLAFDPFLTVERPSRCLETTQIDRAYSKMLCQVSRSSKLDHQGPIQPLECQNSAFLTFGGLNQAPVVQF